MAAKAKAGPRLGGLAWLGLAWSAGVQGTPLAATATSRMDGGTCPSCFGSICMYTLVPQGSKDGRTMASCPTAALVGIW